MEQRYGQEACNGDESEFDDLIDQAVAQIAISLPAPRAPRRIRRREYLYARAHLVHDITADPARLHQMTGLRGETFRALCMQLRPRLSTPAVTVEEKMLIFLEIIRRGSSLRTAAGIFKRGIATVSLVFHEVLNAVTSYLLPLYIRPKAVPADDETPDRIKNDPKFWPYFKGCLGALDGTHIPVHIGLPRQPGFRNRKGTISQNVLAVVGFDLEFSYVLCGWEGSAHDSRVLEDAYTKRFPLPGQGQYYLGDAGYYCSSYIMTPYRGVRYHLREYEKAGKQPETPQELFNLRHSSLRNIVERCFGILKRQNRSLREALEYSFVTQCKVIHAATTLHNFARSRHDLEVPELEELINDPAACIDSDAFITTQMEVLPSTPSRASEGRRIMEHRRDQLAQRMWINYRQYIHQR